MALESIFLILVSVGVFSAALGYGIVPSKSLPFMYGISLTNKNIIVKLAGYRVNLASNRK